MTRASDGAPDPVGEATAVAVTAPEKVGIRVILADPAVRVAILIVFVIMVGFGIIAPILPLYARSFGVSFQAASLLISAFAVARLIFDPIAGPLIDRYGERVTSIAGVLVVGVTSVLAGIAPNFTLAVVFRGAGGAGSSVLFAALYSYLLKIVPSDRMARTLSLFFGALNVGIIAGGPLGGLIADRFDLNTPLFFYAGLCFVAGLLYLRFMSDPPPRTRPDGERTRREAEGSMWRRTWQEVAGLLRNRAFRTVIVLNMMFYWVLAGGYDTLLPLFAREGLGMSEAGVGAIFGLVVLGEFVLLYPAASIADRIGRKPVLLVALTGLGVMLVAVGWAGSPVVLAIMMPFLGFTSGSSAAAPGAMLSDVAPEGGSGTAVGVFRFAGDVGFIIGPTVAGVTVGLLGFRWAFAAMAVPVVLTLGLVARTGETLRRSPARDARPPFGGPDRALDEW